MIQDVHNKIDWDYESVYFFTGDWPETEGWGSSDTSIMLRSVQQDVNRELEFRAKEAV